MPVIAGFDPGLSGAACALSVGDMGIEFMDCIDLPTRSDDSNRQMNIAALGKWLELICPDEAWVENVQPMRGKGKDSNAMAGASAFRFGLACGALRGALEAYSIPVRLVTPSVWKRSFDLLKTGKEASRAKALNLLPEAGSYLKRKLDHNRSEACLIALYGSNQRIVPE